MPATKYVFALDTFSAREPGSKYPTTVHKGTAWYADSPLVTSHPDMFAAKPPEVFPRNWVSPVEQATAAPGEKRTTKRAD